MNTLDYEQDLADKLKQLGSQLRQVRQERSLSLDQVSAKTMIQPRLLNAIEEGRLEQLPEPVYTRGFIRRFAEALDLNGEEFALAIPAIRSYRKNSNWNQIGSPHLRPIHLYLLYVVLIVAAASGLRYLTSRSTSSNPTSTAAVQAQSPSTSTKRGGATSPRPAEKLTPAIGVSKPTPAQKPKSATAPVTKKPVKVGLTVKQESWLEIVVDGKTAFAGILPPGTQRTWTAEQKLVIRAGNAGGVLVSDHGPPTAMGAMGAVAEKIFEPVTPSATLSPQPAASPAGQ